MHVKLEAKSQSLITQYFYYLSGGDFNTEKRIASINETHNLLKLSENNNFKYHYDDFSNSTKTASIGQGIASAMGSTFKLFAAISQEEFETICLKTLETAKTKKEKRMWQGKFL